MFAIQLTVIAKKGFPINQTKLPNIYLKNLKQRKIYNNIAINYYQIRGNSAGKPYNSIKNKYQSRKNIIIGKYWPYNITVTRNESPY